MGDLKEPGKVGEPTRTVPIPDKPLEIEWFTVILEILGSSEIKLLLVEGKNDEPTKVNRAQILTIATGLFNNTYATQEQAENALIAAILAQCNANTEA